MSDVCLYELDAGVATLTMNRPDSLNALNGDLSHALADALATAAADDSVRCVVITGAGRAFSSGADLAEAQERIAEFGNFLPSGILKEYYHPIINAIVTMEKPVIAAVNGIAAGAGLSVALACDLRIASEKAAFLQAFVRIGLIPDAGSNYFLPQLVGYAKALEMSLTGDIIDAETALRLGLVNRVVPVEELVKATREFAEPFATGPTRAYGLTKKAMRFGATNPLSAVLDYEPDLQDQAALTKDSVEGITAFLEKRAPNYKGH